MMKNKRTVKLLDGTMEEHETEATLNISYRPNITPAPIYLTFFGNELSGDGRYITHKTALQIAFELIDMVRYAQDTEKYNDRE